jgi:hypothetical protein
MQLFGGQSDAHFLPCDLNRLRKFIDRIIKINRIKQIY